MADYYPLLSRAVAGLTNNTGEVRRALYERARTALVNQLRNSDPPLSESDITRERLGLEEAIRRIEAEAAESRKPDNAALAPQPEASAKDHPSEETKQTSAEPAAPSDEERELPPPPPPPASIREVLGRAGSLGEASAKSARAARETSGELGGTTDSASDADTAASEPEKTIIGDAPPPPYQEEPTSYRPARNYRGLIKVAVVVLVLAVLASLGYWQRDRVASLFSKSSQPTQTTTTTPPATANGKPKISDRVSPGPQDQKPSAAPATDVAQKAILYEEDPEDPQGKRYVGSVLWRTETVSPGPGLAPELAIRADVDVPERRMKMTLSLRRNADKALPASHTLEIVFNVPPDFAGGGVANVPGVLMKSGEQTRGTPLAGLAVKVTTGYFLVGLSATDADLQRNLQLLRERPWFDIPVVYNDGKRAILGIEKGPAGERVFEDALRAWGQ
ncbi:MAG: hypothetical protein ACTHLY_15030 [Pseudolabrys sp.]